MSWKETIISGSLQGFRMALIVYLWALPVSYLYIWIFDISIESLGLLLPQIIIGIITIIGFFIFYYIEQWLHGKGIIKQPFTIRLG